MLQFSSSQFSNLRWRYFVESLLLKSTPNVSSVVLSSARVAGVDTVTLVVFSTAGAFLGLSLRVDAAWVIVTGVRYVTVCRVPSPLRKSR